MPYHEAIRADVIVNGRSPKSNALTVSLFWDTVDTGNWEQRRVQFKHSTTFAIELRSRYDDDDQRWIRGFVEELVYDDDKSSVSRFAVRRGDVQPISVSSLLNYGSAELAIKDTSGATIGTIELSTDGEATGDDSIVLSLPKTKLQSWEKYDSKMDPRAHDLVDNQPMRLSNGLLVDLMRSVYAVRAPYRTPDSHAANAWVPRWYYAICGLAQIQPKRIQRDDNGDVYTGIMSALVALWFGPERLSASDRSSSSSGDPELDDREKQLLVMQMCLNHHAWAHYVTDKAGRSRRNAGDTWNLIRNTAHPGNMGKDCDDASIEINATFSELGRITGSGGSSWAIKAIREVYNTYCCCMVLCIIRPDGTNTPDGNRAGNTDLAAEPVHPSYLVGVDTGGKPMMEDAPMDEAKHPSRGLHIYCLFVRWDAMRELLFNGGVDLPPQSGDDSLSYADCDRIIVSESTDTFPCQTDADHTVFDLRHVLRRLSDIPELEGATRIPESYEKFVLDDFYRADISLFSEQLLEMTGIAQWDITSTRTGRVGVEHNEFVRKMSDGTPQSSSEYAIQPYSAPPSGGMVASPRANIRYFADTAVAAPSLPLFITNGRKNTISIRTIVSMKNDAPELRYVPMWCMREKAAVCERVLNDKCDDPDHPLTSCFAIEFGQLGVAFALGFDSA